MEAATTPSRADFRAQLHRVIDQIQDDALLQVVLRLLLPQAQAPDAEPALSPAWRQELDRRVREYDPAQNVPFQAVLERLTQASA